MGKILIGLICFLFASCCFFMYSSVPPYESSVEWEKIKKNEKHETIEFVLVAPNQDDERIQDFVKKLLTSLPILEHPFVSIVFRSQNILFPMKGLIQMNSLR
ncbi:MAG: hypothetical protein J5791_11640 [Fibrobacter sp.]|nr:hypothetical protein [Fibrobacter sp.]